MTRHILHEGHSTYLALASPGTRCPHCNAVLGQEGDKYFALDGLQVIQRPRPGEKTVRDWGRAEEHTRERCAQRIGTRN